MLEWVAVGMLAGPVLVGVVMSVLGVGLPGWMVVVLVCVLVMGVGLGVWCVVMGVRDADGGQVVADDGLGVMVGLVDGDAGGLDAMAKLVDADAGSNEGVVSVPAPVMVRSKPAGGVRRGIILMLLGVMVVGRMAWVWRKDRHLW